MCYCYGFSWSKSWVFSSKMSLLCRLLMNAYQLAAPTVPPRNSGCRFHSSVVTILNAGKYSTTSHVCIVLFKWKTTLFFHSFLLFCHTLWKCCCSWPWMWPLCRNAGSQWALEQAKYNLVNEYLLVGVTEELEDFVMMLEAALPRFFRGATELYRTGQPSFYNIKIKIHPKLMHVVLCVVR